jgi:hypothetical protein
LPPRRLHHHSNPGETTSTPRDLAEADVTETPSDDTTPDPLHTAPTTNAEALAAAVVPLDDSTKTPDFVNND